MSKQSGLVKLEGTLEAITFYRSRDGYIARMKSSLDKKRVKRDPAFAASRKASAEFGRAGAAARLLRDAFLTTGGMVADTRILARLTGKLVGSMGTDTSHMKGDRLVGDC